jgi:hypothetical protein
MIFDGSEGIGWYPAPITSLVLVSSKYTIIKKIPSNEPEGLLEVLTDSLSLVVGNTPEILGIEGTSANLFPHQIDDVSAGDKIICFLFAGLISTDLRDSSGSDLCEMQQGIYFCMLSRGAGLVPPFSRTVKASTFQRNLFVDTHKADLFSLPAPARRHRYFPAVNAGPMPSSKSFWLIVVGRSFTLLRMTHLCSGMKYDPEMFLRGVVITSPIILGRSSILVKVGVQKWDGE